MKKGLFAIFFIAVLLIISAGVISAADNQDNIDDNNVLKSKSISVKVIWDDASDLSKRPNEVRVNLIKDGAVVDNAVLNGQNSWKATFKNLDDGSYKVQQATDLGDYSVSVTGNADSGFVITNKLHSDALGAAADEQLVEEDDSDADENDDGNSSSEEVVVDDNGTEDENVTEDADDGAEDENVTDEDVADETDDENQTDIDGSAPTKDIPSEQKAKNKVVKPIKKHKVSPTKLKRTGIPLVALVLVTFAAIFVPFSRRK